MSPFVNQCRNSRAYQSQGSALPVEKTRFHCKTWLISCSRTAISAYLATGVRYQIEKFSSITFYWVHVNTWKGARWTLPAGTLEKDDRTNWNFHLSIVWQTANKPWRNSQIIVTSHKLTTAVYVYHKWYWVSEASRRSTTPCKSANDQLEAEKKCVVDGRKTRARSVGFRPRVGAFLQCRSRYLDFRRRLFSHLPTYTISKLCVLRRYPPFLSALKGGWTLGLPSKTQNNNYTLQMAEHKMRKKTANFKQIKKNNGHQEAEIVT